MTVPPSRSTDPLDPSSPPIQRLIAIMARLRDPVRGCPWDKEQSFASIAPYTIEEAYEVADAIQQGDMKALREELGDLLLQVVFHAQMGREAGSFDIDDVARSINDKMVKRHPHVFGEATVAGAAAQTRAWEAQKAEERLAEAAAAGRPAGALDGVAIGLPALTRALKLQQRLVVRPGDCASKGRASRFKPGAHDCITLGQLASRGKHHLDGKDPTEQRDAVTPRPR